MATILVNNPIHEAGLAKLREAGHEVLEGPLTGKELDQALAEARGMIVRSGTTVTEEMLSKAPDLEVIGRAGVGVDNIDLDACQDAGVAVFNTPTASSNAVAELTLGHMISVARWLPRAITTMREGEWAKKDCRGVELADRTLGLVGIGRIGARVAELAQAFGMSVEAYDPYVTEERARELGVDPLHEDLLEMAPRADVVSIHTPLTPETEALVGSEFFSRAEEMIVVNCARGGVLDEEALLAALDDGTVLGAGLDVYEEEPPGVDALVEHPRVSTTPHIGAQTDEAQRKAGTFAADGVMAVLEGGEPDTRIV